MKGLRPLVLPVKLGADCSCGVRFNSGKSFHREGVCREVPGAEAVRTLGRGGGEANEPDGVDGVDDVGNVDGLVTEERDRMRRGGARARGTRPVSIGIDGECCWYGTLVACWGKEVANVSTGSVAPVYTTVVGSANGDNVPASCTADNLARSFPVVTVCISWYVVGATGGTPLLVGGAEYVTALGLASLIASSSARVSACHRNVELRSDVKLWRLLAKNEELLAGRWFDGYG